MSKPSKPKTKSAPKALLGHRFALDWRKHKLAILIAVIFLATWASSPLADYMAVYNGSSASSAAIKDIADNSGFSYAGKVLFYKSKPELVNADVMNDKCPNDNEAVIEYGCYLPSQNKVYILKVADSQFKDIHYTTAAHEVLHIAWRKLSPSQRYDTAASLKEFYSDKARRHAGELRKILEPYGDDESVIASELHSFVGSEVPDEAIGEPLTSYYRKYFSDRGASVEANIQFEGKIKHKIASIKAESKGIDRAESDLRKFKAVYLDRIAGYLPSNIYYGDVARYNQNVNAYNNNLKIYKQKYSDYRQRLKSYNKDVKKFNTTMRALYPSETQLKTK